MTAPVRSSDGFMLHARLAADTLAVGNLPLCAVRLMDDRRFPWLVLVPRRVGLREPWDLQGADFRQLWDESARVGRAMQQMFAATKMNIAALGNMVPQLHVHHVARFTGDAAWPAPVWGQGVAEPYGDSGPAMVMRLVAALEL